MIRTFLCFNCMIIYFHLTSAQISQQEALKNITECDINANITLTCAGNEMIAIHSVQYAYHVRCVGTCCNTYTSTDCFVNAEDTDIQDIRRACSGKSSCNAPSPPDKIDFSTCSLSAMDISYIFLKYVCIPKERIASMCSNRQTLTSDDVPLYLTNENYPSVTAGSTSCSCSLEVYSCSSSINMYILDTDLYLDTSDCYQTLKVLDGSNISLHTIGCESHYSNQIESLTANSHYLKIDFIDNSTSNQGYFFLGFEASESGVSFSLSCNYEQETWCVGCGDVPVIANGNIELSNMNDSSSYAAANVICDSGYETNTSAINCLANGTWPAPDCTEKDKSTPSYGGSKDDKPALNLVLIIVLVILCVLLLVQFGIMCFLQCKIHSIRNKASGGDAEIPKRIGMTILGSLPIIGLRPIYTTWNRLYKTIHHVHDTGDSVEMSSGTNKASCRDFAFKERDHKLRSTKTRAISAVTFPDEKDDMACDRSRPWHQFRLNPLLPIIQHPAEHHHDGHHHHADDRHILSIPGRKNKRRKTKRYRLGTVSGKNTTANNILPSNRELHRENRSPEQYPDTTCLWAYDTNVEHLLHQNILPSNRELHILCRNLGRRSQKFSNICGMICKQVMNTAEDIVDVWASYCIEDHHSDDTVSIVFVVIRTDTSKNIHLKDYKYHLVSQNTFSNESEILLARELSDETHDISSKRDTLEELRKCIARHADDLLERHSNIHVIIPSLNKSKGYYSANHSIVDEPCIAFYVPVKGYIPINEDPFPQKIDGFEVDVLEGKFETYNGGPNEFHVHLKMGLAIHANILDDNKHLLGGTLGGFIDHPKYKMCGITCAHVVCSSEEMSSVESCGIKTDFDKHVFQPVNHESKSFGRVEMAVYERGDESSSGVEAALFNIEKRHPKDGSFPMAFNDIEAGFTDKKPLTYNSGNVCESSDIHLRTEVYKYGMATGITRGSFALQGAVVRKEKMEVNGHHFGYSLKNQLVVLQIGSEPFAEAGDSGALVMIEDDHHDSVAIGIVEGGIKGRVFVTPICDILRAFRCSDLKMYKFNNLKNGCLSTDWVDVDVSEVMDFNN